MNTFDPMAEVTNKPQYTTNLFGKFDVTARRMHKPEGEKQREWQPGDPEKSRNVKFDFALTTIDAMGLTRPIQERSTMNFTDEWNNIIWPSIEAQGCKTLHPILGKFVEVEVVPTGETYTDKNGKERNGTAFKVLRIFPDEAACIKAYEDSAGVSHEDEGNEEALSVARALVSVSKGDMKKLAANLKAAKSPYTVDSQAIIDLLTESAVPA